MPDRYKLRPSQQNADILLEHSQQMVADALLNRSHDENATLAIFRGSATLAQKRLACYRNNLYATWERVLANTYPVIQALVGDPFFYGIAQRYGTVYPSRCGDLNQFGADLAVFLTDFAPTANYPYFPDMARLEWQLHCAYYAANGQALLAADWATLTPDIADRAQLSLHPACALLASDWAIGEIWHAHQPANEVSLPTDIHRANYLLVTRPRWRTEVLLLSAAAYTTLRALQAGQTLGAAVDAALAIDAHFDFGSYLSQWTAHAVFVEVKIAERLQHQSLSRPIGDQAPCS